MESSLRFLRHWAEVLPVFALQGLIALLPLMWVPRIGEFLGWLAFDILRFRRGVSLRNLALATGDRYSDQERVRLGREAYRSFGSLAMEFLAMNRIPPKRMERHMVLENIEALWSALREGKGVLLVTGHFGNWELTAAAMNAAGIPLSVYVGRQRNPIFDQLINGIRRRAGSETVHKSVVMKGFLKSLKANRVMAILADQHDTQKRYYVSYFGRPVSAAPGPATIARRTGSPIVFMASIREGRFRYRSVFRRLDYEVTDDAERDILTITQKLFHELESEVSRHPGQYFWMHNRWRPIPPSVQLSEINRAFLAGRVAAEHLPPRAPEPS